MFLSSVVGRRCIQSYYTAYSGIMQEKFLPDSKRRAKCKEMENCIIKSFRSSLFQKARGFQGQRPWSRSAEREILIRTKIRRVARIRPVDGSGAGDPIKGSPVCRAASEANKIVLGLAASRSRSEGEARAARRAAAQRGEAARGPREARRASPHQGADSLPKPLARALLPISPTERRKARHIKLLGAARGLYPRTLQNALSRGFFDPHRAAQRVQNGLAP